MKLYLLLGFLLVAHAWAKPKDVKEAENDMPEEADDDVPEDEENQVEGGYTDERTEDPCFDHACPIGKECEVDGDQAFCTCAHACAEEAEDRAKVCSTTNVTFDSECELQRQKCLCQNNQAGCVEDYRHTHMDYYGSCKEIQECTEEEMIDFPVRMRNWLFLVMEELADRKELPKPAMKMAKRAEKQPKRWVLPTIWKFCVLDDSHDMYVDPEELRAITAPLKGMEHCTGPFVELCDADNNGSIDLLEWSTCLGLDDEDTEDMEAKCRTLHHFS